MSETPPIRSPPFFSSFSNSPPFIYLLQITKTTQRLWKSAHMAKAIVHISAKEEAKQQKGEKKNLFMDKNFHIMIIVICNVIYIYWRAIANGVIWWSRKWTSSVCSSSMLMNDLWDLWSRQEKAKECLARVRPAENTPMLKSYYKFSKEISHNSLPIFHVSLPQFSFPFL